MPIGLVAGDQRSARSWGQAGSCRFDRCLIKTAALFRGCDGVTNLNLATAGCALEAIAAHHLGLCWVDDMNRRGLDGEKQAQQYRIQHLGHYPKLERMAEVPLNFVAFRFNPGGLDDSELDALNRKLGERMIEDGQFLLGTSKWGGRTIFRPAFSNWRTRYEDVEALAQRIVECGSALD